MKTIKQLYEMKGKEKIVMLTCYDANMAKIIEFCKIDAILVGDSVANVILGYKDTKSISLEEMIHHCKAVARSKVDLPIIGDMPIGTYEDKDIALKNANFFIEAGCNAVKIEGPKIDVAAFLTENNIPVMGHLGLTPQTAQSYKVKGKTKEEYEKIINDAKALDSAGCFAIVLECITLDLAREITKIVSCPTIGIGSGPYCDGQILVTNDLLGLNFDNFKPKFVKKYANLKEDIIRAISEYRDEVKKGIYPSLENSYL